jgi:hypothetical protein
MVLVRAASIILAMAKIKNAKLHIKVNLEKNKITFIECALFLKTQPN